MAEVRDLLLSKFRGALSQHARTTCDEHLGATGLKRRQGEHERGEATKDLDFEVDVKSDDYKVQRGRESQLDTQYKPALNKIKPISDKNPKKEEYLQ